MRRRTLNTTRYLMIAIVVSLSLLTVREIRAVCVGCGDANSDGSVGIGDAVAIKNYLVSNAPLPCPIEADCDDDAGVTVRDLCKILDYLFSGGAAPICPTTMPPTSAIPAGEDTLKVVNDTLPPLATELAILLYYANSDNIVGMNFAMKLALGNTKPTVDSVVFGPRIAGSGYRDWYIRPGFPGTINFNLAWAGSILAPGSGLFATVWVSATPASVPRGSVVDTVHGFAPNTRPLFHPTDRISGGSPEIRRYTGRR